MAKKTSFSSFETSIGNFQKEVERKALESVCAPFPDSELSKEKSAERLTRAKNDFWYFDKVYFTKEMYSDGFSELGEFHRDIVKHACTPGVQVIAGARKHAKTAELKKYFAWEVLTGRLIFGGTLSSTLPNARNILMDIAELIMSERVKFDFNPVFEELNSDQFTLRIPTEQKLRRFMAFSEGRSVRGATHLFNRPQKLLCDDLETRQSSLNDTAVSARIKIVSEAYQSMGEGGVLVVLGNNFDERCAINRLLNEQNEGVLPSNWRVHIYPAWDGVKPLWPERFPAKSEAELRAMLKPLDESEWQAEFQQKPVPPDGFIFKRHQSLPVYFDIPSDAKGVRWCDPNLAKKSQGDTTSIHTYLWSPSTNYFYIKDIVCRSFSESNKLLDAFYVDDPKVLVLGMDGNVNQESTWTNNVKNYGSIKKRPPKRVEWRRYRADDLAKNIQGAWNEGRILLPADINESPDGRAFLTQIYAFSGKKAGLKDDAPDGLICSHELITERRIYRPNKRRAPRTITDFFNF